MKEQTFNSRVITLLELMRRFNVSAVYDLGQKMGKSFGLMDADPWGLPDKKAAPKLRMTVQALFPHFASFAEFIPLPTAAMPIRKLLHMISVSPDIVKNRDIDDALRTFAGRVEDELTQLAFYQILPDRAKYYDGARAMFHEDQSKPFPFGSSLYDIEEAGRCLAVGRSTACVFHLMRAITPVLQAIADKLGFEEQRDWGRYLNEMKIKSWEKFPDNRSKENDEQRAFYADLESRLRAYKEAWRNPTMHNPEKVYTEEQAEEIFACVRGFMRQAATRLEEPMSAELKALLE